MAAMAMPSNLYSVPIVIVPLQRVGVVRISMISSGNYQVKMTDTQKAHLDFFVAVLRQRNGSSGENMLVRPSNLRRDPIAIVPLQKVGGVRVTRSSSGNYRVNMTQNKLT